MAKQISFAAEKIWRSMPKADQDLILASVWCSHCRGSCAMVDYSADMIGADLLLSGKCRTCGGEVRRLVETT